MSGNNSNPSKSGGGGGSGKSQGNNNAPNANNAQSSSRSSSSTNANNENNNTLANQVFRLALFDHLPRKQTSKDPDLIEEDRIIHPATVHLGLMYNRGIIRSDDDRAHALIAVFCQIVEDYKTPPKKILREDLDKCISKQVQYLVDSRQISKGMGNIIKYLRQCISKIPPDLSEAESKSILLGKLQSFLDEKMLYAGESIARYVTSTINDNDVILTFGSSPLIRKILLQAAQTKTFRVVVIDTRPLNEGLETLASLSQSIHCVYSPLSGAAVAMNGVTKVIFGASCLLSNGSMLAPAGTAMVAALAKSKQIPVIVASESYKFSDKVQLDSIVFNELGHSSEIAVMVSASEAQEITGNEAIATSGQDSVAVPQQVSGYRGSADKLSLLNVPVREEVDMSDVVTVPAKVGTTPTSSSVKLPYEVVNLRYDLTPLSNISVVATETGLIPPTSIPVLIREIQSDLASGSK